MPRGGCREGARGVRGGGKIITITAAPPPHPTGSPGAGWGPGRGQTAPRGGRQGREARRLAAGGLCSPPASGAPCHPPPPSGAAPPRPNPSPCSPSSCGPRNPSADPLPTPPAALLTRPSSARHRRNPNAALFPPKLERVTLSQTRAPWP